MERNLEYEASPDNFRKKWEPKEDEISKQIEEARKLVDRVGYTKRDLISIASLTASLNVDGHRSDLVILKAARAQAAIEGRTAVTDHDIAMAAELALPHRLKRGPFMQTEITMEDLQERIESLQGAANKGQPEVDEDQDKNTSDEKKKVSESATVEEREDLKPPDDGSKPVFQDATAHWWDGGEKTKIGEAFNPRKLDTPLDQMIRKQGGRRSRTKTEQARGRYVQARPTPGENI